MWSEFANYLLEDHIVEAGKSKDKHLAAGTALQYMSLLMNLAAVKIRRSGSDRAKLFFTEILDSNKGDAGVWWSKLTKNLSREIYQRTKRRGENTDQSATPVYGLHFRAMVRSIYIWWCDRSLLCHQLNDTFYQGRSLAKHGSKGSASRQFTLVSEREASGRSAELAWTTWTALDWDPMFKCVFGQLVQFKKSADKLMCFVSGATRHECWFLAFGDYLLLVVKGTVYDKELPWLFPFLQETNSP